MMRFVRGFPVAVVLAAVLVPCNAHGQDLAGGPSAYAAGFRELAVPGTRQLPPRLFYTMVHASDRDRTAVEALADTMVAVALDLAADVTAEGIPTVASQQTLHAIIHMLRSVGSFPVTARRGSRLDGAGDRLIRIAVEMPMTPRDPLNRALPLRSLANLPDEDKWKQKLVDLARGPYPLSAAAVLALWGAFQGEGRELVSDMYRRGELSDARTKSWAEFVSGRVRHPPI